MIRKIPSTYVSVSCTCQKTYTLPEDGQQLRPKHVAAFINK